MSALHLPTMLWVMLLTSFTLAGSVLLVAYRTQSRDGLSTWGWSMAVHGLSYVAFALRYAGWLDLSIVLSNLLVATSLALNLWAVSQFQRDRTTPVPGWLMWGPLGIATLFSLLLLQQHQMRIALISLVTAFQAGLLARHALGPGLTGPREKGRVLLFIGAALLGLVLVLRFVSAASNEHWDKAVAVPDSLQAATYLFGMVTLLMNTMGYVLMHKERAVDLQHEQATHDALTGLFNRRALLDQARVAVSSASRGGLELGVLMLDLDHFKRVNDEHGHQAGDKVLKEAAHRMRLRLRLHDVLGRYGGEEFVLVLNNTNLVNATGVAEGIRRVIEAQPFEFNGKRIHITISAGVHVRRPDNNERTVDDMIAAADRALYQAKQNGRNRVEVGE